MMSSRFAPWIAATVLAAAAFAQSPTYHAARQPSIDHSIATIHSGDMLSIPGLFTDFVLAGGGQFVELPSGEARLTGRVFSNASIYSAYLLDIVRRPVLGEAPTALGWLVVCGMAILGWTGAFLFFSRFRARVPYWL